MKGETERIDSRFLEPACGDGNFLVQILRRKLAAKAFARTAAYDAAIAAWFAGADAGSAGDSWWSPLVK